MRRNYASLEDALENGEGVERPFLCPEHDDTDPSASVNVDKGVWYCFTCHAAGRADRRGGAKQLTNDMKLIIESLKGEQTYPLHTVRWLDIFDAYSPHPYWVKRFGTEISKRWRLGIHPTTGNPTYPVRTPRGMVAGVVQRTQGKPKYLYPTNVPMSRFLFGYKPSRVGTIVVVEGAADCIAVSEAAGSMGLMVVASYGAGLHRPQVDLINALNPRRVLLGFDDDEAGERAKKRAYGLATKVETIRWGAKDPGELDRSGILAALGEEREDGELGSRIA